MKDPLCDAQALHADSMSSFREGSTHSSLLSVPAKGQKHKASKRGGNAVEVTIGRGREQDAPVGGQLSCRYMGAEEGLEMAFVFNDHGSQWSLKSKSDSGRGVSMSGLWTGDCHASHHAWKCNRFPD